MELYVVKQGDTLQGIAEQFGISAGRIAYDNELAGENLVVGQVLILLRPEIVYTIENGDTLEGIADTFGTTELQLLRNNSYLLNEDFLLPERQIVISYADMEKREIEIFGYAYAFISEAVLEEACLYIQELLPFSYGFNEDGSLMTGCWHRQFGFKTGSGW